jgi:hypothetical protein
VAWAPPCGLQTLEIGGALVYNKKRFLATVAKEPSATGGTPETVLDGTLKSVLAGSALDGVEVIAQAAVFPGTPQIAVLGVTFASNKVTCVLLGQGELLGLSVSDGNEALLLVLVLHYSARPGTQETAEQLHGMQIPVNKMLVVLRTPPIAEVGTHKFVTDGLSLPSTVKLVIHNTFEFFSL